MDEEDERPINKSVLYTLTFFGCIILLLIGSTLYFALQAREAKIVKGGENISANITKALSDGADASISKLLALTNNCQVASVSYTNFTRQVVDITCIPKIISDANMTIVPKK